MAELGMSEHRNFIKGEVLGGVSNEQGNFRFETAGVKNIDKYLYWEVDFSIIT